MIRVAERYIELTTELLFERERAGGSLSDEAEAQYVDELDRLWWAMTKDEQDHTERALSHSELEAPDSLRETDVRLGTGAKSPPRRKLDEAEAA